jgi:hypothetical protein
VKINKNISFFGNLIIEIVPISCLLLFFSVHYVVVKSNYLVHKKKKQNVELAGPVLHKWLSVQVTEYFEYLAADCQAVLNFLDNRKDYLFPLKNFLNKFTISFLPPMSSILILMKNLMK